MSEPVSGVWSNSGHQESSDHIQVELYRRQSSIRKLRAVFELFELALHQARVGTRWRHPDWNDEEIEKAARQLVTGTILGDEEVARMGASDLWREMLGRARSSSD